MNTKRAIGFGVILYLISFIVFGAIMLVMGIGPENYSEGLGLREYIIWWILYIPIVLLLAKWYFKKDAPTLKKGFHFGLIAVGIAFVGDGLSVLGAWAVGESLDTFKVLYTDWKLYATIVWIVTLCSYAGYEFDGTYSGEVSNE
jgi:hypothetical protein